MSEEQKFARHYLHCSILIYGEQATVIQLG